MTRTAAWRLTAGMLLSLLLGDAGCGARSSLLVDTDADTGGGGVDPGGGGAGSCESATFGPIVVDQVDATGKVWDVRAGQLAWNGTRFGALWEQNRNGRIELIFALLDPNAETPVVKTTLGGVDDRVQMAAMAWNGEVFVIYSAHEDGLLRRRTMSGSGEPLAMPAIVLALRPYAELTAVLPLGPGAGEGVHWNEQSAGNSGLVPFFALVSEGGEIAVGPSKLAIGVQGPELRVFGAVRDGGVSRVAWLRQPSTGTSTAWLGAFDDVGSSVGEPELVHEADTIHLAYEGPPVVALENGGGAVGFWDVDAGARVARVSKGSVETIVLPKGTDRPALTRAADGALGVVVSHGPGQIGQPPHDVFLEVVREDGQVEAPLLVNGDSEQGSCAEAYTVEASGNSFGILWLEGCTSVAPGRSLHFSVVHRCPN